MYKECGGDFVFNHKREMKTMLLVLCRNLAKSLYRIEIIRMSRFFFSGPWPWRILGKTMIVLLRGLAAVP